MPPEILIHKEDKLNHTSVEQFYQETQRLLDEFVRVNPTMGSYLGDHRYDDRFGSYTPGAISKQRQSLEGFLQDLEALDTVDWPLDARIDRIIIIQVLKKLIRDYDQLRSFQRNPGVGPDNVLGGVYVLIIREFAPLPERMKSILGRLRETPRVLNEVRELIVPHEVPKIWAKLAVQSARRGVGLFAGFIPMLAEATPDMKNEVLEAANNAASALNDYASWVEEKVLPNAEGDFSVGKEIFDEMLREDHMVEYDSDELIAIGWKLIEETTNQMDELSKQIDSAKSTKEILEEAKEDHPSAGDLLDTYRQWMDAARQFVINKGIVSIPDSESIRIEPTPSFLRPLIPYAAYNMPGFLEDVQEGIFIVTPVEEDASPEEAIQKLRGHPNSNIPVTALHEAYPGHHLQFVVANRLPSLPRKFGAFLSSLFIEGWAFYCEELMEELGFIDKPIQKLARLKAQLWRACRIVIDASLHTGRMGIDEAVDFLVERAGLERGDAQTEVNRYTSSPTQPQCYLMGKLQILDIVEEYKQRFPDKDLRQMHDDILNSGPLPPRLMRLQLFGEN
jgi:uncharacterized protein (DUF885 family)